MELKKYFKYFFLIVNNKRTKGNTINMKHSHDSSIPNIIRMFMIDIVNVFCFCIYNLKNRNC